MSDTSRPTSRWLSSMPTRVKSNNNPTRQAIPLILARRKLLRSAKNHQQTFAQRMAKVKHDTEELYQLYYSNNIKFDTFQQQIITGTRISSLQTSSTSHHRLNENSSNTFDSRHCVSREQLSQSDMYNDENQISYDEQKQSPVPVKRSVQVRIDNNPTIAPSSPTASSRSSSPEFRISISSNSNLNTLDTSSFMRQDEFNESTLNKRSSFFVDPSVDSVDHRNIKPRKATNDIQSLSTKLSLITLHSLPQSTTSLINSKKDPINTSYSSFSTVNSLEQQNPPHVLTGRAVTAHQRLPVQHKQRAKSSMTTSPNSFSRRTPAKPSPPSSQSSKRGSPVFIGAQRVVSIPSKCSRYVLVTFPPSPIRYNTPTYVERLLLPERFPTLFQNIVHSHEQNRHNK
ncbi:unnamed protein product [Rotaria magnacalcarata]|uniref:Uncharacterized protein n=3 Tax=Rotaria magnacalcarata TaxID=392030 RepID=A0A816Y0Y3_9BILA|nr:unnamed protein product [Rotaria magnacalcarata]CAF1474278.1 unnamed protein product [Rotaria magnacalcarata]CAF2045083.1 unnamed protein product [Rotaria magnacalcarata]CAF2092790.1 unnamed protein product [Rotaria magnacalcarata]CAF2154729.1 unnamed protein product [Rotaria magnacalcarata]